jgi:hypothetical protein
MMRWTLLSTPFFVLAAWGCLSGPARADWLTAPADPQRLGELVRYLGDNDYQVREQASRELFEIGLPAKEALLEGTKNTDPEIRRRCRDLLPEILEADRQAKLAAFIADTTGKLKHDLPCWERYRQIAGEDTGARQLFIDMQKNDTGLLHDAQCDPEHAGEQCAGLCQALFNKLYGRGLLPHERREVNLAEVAPLLLVASDPRVKLPVQQRYLLQNFLYQPTARAALAGSSATPFKKLVLAWMYRQTDDELAVQQMFFLITNLDMKEGIDYALKVIQEKKVKAQGLGQALTTIGKLGNAKKHLSLLEPYLADQTVVGNFALNRERGVTQIRDVALAMMVHLTNQSHRDYGFVFSQTNPALKFYANFLGFGSEDQRKVAFTKWQHWVAAQKK